MEGVSLVKVDLPTSGILLDVKLIFRDKNEEKTCLIDEIKFKNAPKKREMPRALT